MNESNNSSPLIYTHGGYRKLSAPTENVPISLNSNVPISPTDNRIASSRRTNQAGS